MAAAYPDGIWAAKETLSIWLLEEITWCRLLVPRIKTSSARAGKSHLVLTAKVVRFLRAYFQVT
jgi:hypothetical protein